MSDAPARDVIPESDIRLMREIRHYVVENVRTARRFLKRCDRDIDIDSITFTVLDEHTPSETVAEMLSPIAEGHDIGVISEAGCPAVADPGADLVALAQSRGIRVVPLVGPSSIMLSLMASGFNGQTFTFNGYLPREGKALAEKLHEMERLIRSRRQTQIFIETPYRNNKLIATLISSLPSGMRLCVASDITGPSEKIITRPLSAWARSKYDYDKIPAIFLLYD